MADSNGGPAIDARGSKPPKPHFPVSPANAAFDVAFDRRHIAADRSL
jgi:hypothetical protein